jgi:hypothetical protein
MSQPVSSDMRHVCYLLRRTSQLPWVGYFGGDYELNKYTTVSLYTSRLKDAWDQSYFGTSFTYPISDELALLAGFNYYRAVDEGKKLLGEFDNNIWSGKVGVRFGAHTVSPHSSNAIMVTI